jgi:hypothetical protein
VEFSLQEQRELAFDVEDAQLDKSLGSGKWSRNTPALQVNITTVAHPN